MDGGGSNPFMRRSSTKRNYSTMATPADSQSDSLDSLFVEDDHYTNEHSSRRPRLALPPMHRNHYPGDGLDFRRPVMSTWATTASRVDNGATNVNEGYEGGSTAPVIDLTDEDGMGGESQGAASSASGMATAGSSRASRLPRFGADVIDVERINAGEDEEQREFDDYLPSTNRVSQIRHTTRPQFSGLRRPARPPSQPRDMDDIEFLDERPRSRPRLGSQIPTPAGPGASAPRSITPYPIDLTADDDEVVHLDTRQRDSVNINRPDTTAGTGTRSMADRGYGHIGNIANLLRDRAPNFGERLMQRMQRLQGFAGLDGEMRAQQQALDHFNHNHGPDSHNGFNPDPQQQNIPQHHHHGPGHTPHPHRRTGGLSTAEGTRARMDGHNLRINFGNPAPMAGAHRAVQVNLPGMMDYGMTGFDMGMGGNRPQSPPYSPPPEPEKGFTRSPGEDEVVVCPNCGDELAMGENDMKQEVWIIKTCGHAYCGECAINRGRTTSKKGKGKVTDADIGLPPAFKKCVVEGCAKPAAKNSMVHVFLGS